MPTRTCCGCQKRDEQRNLVRWVAEATGRIKIDDTERQPGRGAYLHRTRSCVEAAAKGGFARSFRRKTQHVDVERLWELPGMKQRTRESIE
ncbi:MAG: hypothetical protein JWN44_4108 [Myxococcales bacterium]|nr:hypothetical protein [Myxococcales bacterium]